MTSPGAPGEGEAVTLWAYRKRNGDFMYDSNKIDDLDVEMRALPVAAYNALLARANTAKVAADLMRAERDALRGEVATLRGARSAEDVCEMLCEASCVDVTPERCARIWSLLKHPATTMTTLAVIADERGESYAKVRALLKEARGWIDPWRLGFPADLLARIDAALKRDGEG